MSSSTCKAPWPPAEHCLPNLDTLEEISRGEDRQQQELLPPEKPDDSREGRLARILETPPGALKTARIARYAR